MHGEEQRRAARMFVLGALMVVIGTTIYIAGLAPLWRTAAGAVPSPAPDALRGYPVPAAAATSAVDNR